MCEYVEKKVYINGGCNCSRLVDAVIHAAPVRGSCPEEAGSVMCVIRRCEDASAALLPVDGGPPAITNKLPENIIFRLDCKYTILCKFRPLLSLC